MSVESGVLKVECEEGGKAAKATLKKAGKAGLANEAEKRAKAATEGKLAKESTGPSNGPEDENGKAGFLEGEVLKVESGVGKRENALDVEPEVEAVRLANQCPRCQTISANPFIYPGVNRQTISGNWEGKPYQVIESRRIKCEKCGQIHFVKKYL